MSVSRAATAILTVCERHFRWYQVSAVVRPLYSSAREKICQKQPGSCKNPQHNALQHRHCKMCMRAHRAATAVLTTYERHIGRASICCCSAAIGQSKKSGFAQSTFVSCHAHAPLCVFPCFQAQAPKIYVSSPAVQSPQSIVYGVGILCCWAATCKSRRRGLARSSGVTPALSCGACPTASKLLLLRLQLTTDQVSVKTERLICRPLLHRLQLTTDKADGLSWHYMQNR